MAIKPLNQAKLSYTNTLKRQGWVKDNLLKKSEKSKWAPYIGGTSSAIVYSKTDSSCGTGHVINFDYSAFTRARAIKGDQRIYGNGVQKRKFSARLQIEEWSFTVENGRAFDGCDVDDLTNKAHSDSVHNLSQNWVVSKDQLLFDVSQGGIGAAPTHIYNLGTSFEYNQLLDIENAAKTGRGFKKPAANGAVSNEDADRRVPLRGFRTDGGEEMYMVFLDTYTATKLKKDPKYQTIIINADVRGNKNRAINFIIGKFGRTIYVEMGDFTGETDGEGTFEYQDSLVEFSGLRKYATKDGEISWEGQANFELWYSQWLADKAAAEASGISIYSRNLMLGGGALQFGMGKMPDYQLREEPYDGKESESHMDVWMNAQRTELTLEAGEDSRKAKIAEISFSVIAVDMKHT